MDPNFPEYPYMEPPEPIPESASSIFKEEATDDDLQEWARELREGGR